MHKDLDNKNYAMRNPRNVTFKKVKKYLYKPTNEI